ncbi:hypothetical protein [Thermomonospora amylolytica]|uniref:hypothetical protein n=1 Tax=Thermomonospora amylolytica TaxID=1411117 RepID=UPI001300AF33|nr:hypothetical protein [Thermomonospora amylolytica]
MKAAVRLVLAHGPFALVVVAAVAVRRLAMLGYPSVLWFVGDSYTYLQGALELEPSDLRPSGYSIFLWLLGPAHSFTVVLAVQHAVGVAIGVLVYAVVWRAARAAWPDRIWLPGLVATPFAAPVLLDGYLLQLGHLLMADLLFTFWVTAAVTVVLWRRRMTWWSGALAGLLVAFGALTRSVGLPLLVVVLVGMAARRAGWRAMAAAVAACALPVLGYMAWFESVHGRFAMTRTDQIFLYGRTVDFADCSRIGPRPEVAVMCRDHLEPHPQIAPAFGALWGEDSPFRRMPDGIRSPQANELAGEFAWAAIREQPGDYVRVVVRDTFRAFEWERRPYPTPWTARNYEFREGASLRESYAELAYPYGGDTAVARVVEPYAGWVRAYQDVVYLRGPMLGGLLLVGLAGMAVRIRRLGGPVLLPWSVGLALLVVPAATADFDPRYVLPALPFAAMAAGLALVPAARRPEPATPAETTETADPKTDPDPDAEPDDKPGPDPESDPDDEPEPDPDGRPGAESGERSAETIR